MTSISSAGLQYRQSPLERLQTELQSEVSSGTISADDQTALSSALDSIDSTLKSERQSGGSGKPPSHDDMKAKISDLIDQQVQSGALTSDQASELQNVFDQTFSGGPGGPRGPGGPGGPGGPPPGGPPPGGQDGDDSATGTASSSSSDDITKLLQDFLKTLQDSSNSSGYGADGSNLMSQLQSLVVDYQA